MPDWPSPQGDLPYRSDALHVWAARMPEGWKAEGDILSPAERERATRFVFDRGRMEYTFHHSTLRTILGRYTGVAPERVPLAARPNGKPVLEAPYERWRFNLAHSGPVLLCAVAEACEVGVDVERVRPMPDAAQIAARFFAPDEREALERLDAAEREAAFFACWTRKEAFLKATGEGLRRDLESFAVPVEPALRGPWRIAGNWSVFGLPEFHGCACALAVKGDLPPVRTWEFAGPSPPI